MQGTQSGEQAMADRVDEATLTELVEADLREGGVLSTTLPGYTERPAQIELARRVADALESGEHLIAEAGTGTGKSLAYLLPIVRSGRVALISTANKALQEQLFYKDIPFVQQHVRDFRAALVKGMGNYLCLDRLQEEQAFQRIVQTPAFERMERLLEDPDGWDGDLDLLPDTLPAEVRARVSADSDQCAWRSCPFFADCYVRKMRERSRDAQVIVVNHTLLLLDAAMDGFLLPERDVIVIDEAHHLEDEATRAFTITVTPGRVQSLLAQRRLREHASAKSVQEAIDADQRTWEALTAIYPDTRGRQHLAEPLQEGLRLASALDDVASSLATNRPDAVDEKEQMLYEKLVKRARSLAHDVHVVFNMDGRDERVFYIEYERGRGSGRSPRAPMPSVSAAPLTVADLLRAKLFDRISTVATSATMAIRGDFRFFRSRVGLNDAREVVLPLAFDYESNALLYVPRLQREPAYGEASGPYLEEIAHHMRELVRASSGRAFLLFSSQRALEAVHRLLHEPLLDEGFSLLVQGRNLGRAEMIRQFQEQPAAVLFGLKSFWEGVDVPGEALSLVVIDKLPFDPPDDPVQEARVNRMKESGENWFGDYVLPQAVLRLKQGIGRLLRTHTDVGVMAILDKRLYTKSYGSMVLQSLPPARRTNSIADVRSFFADTR